MFTYSLLVRAWRILNLRPQSFSVDGWSVERLCCCSDHLRAAVCIAEGCRPCHIAAGCTVEGCHVSYGCWVHCWGLPSLSYGCCVLGWRGPCLIKLLCALLKGAVSLHCCCVGCRVPKLLLCAWWGVLRPCCCVWEVPQSYSLHPTSAMSLITASS